MSADSNGLKLGWGDKSLSMFGRDVLLFFLMLAVASLVVWLGTERAGEHKAIVEVLDKRLQQNVVQQEKIVEQLEVTNYYLSLPADHPQRKQLAVPKSLRQYQNE